MSKKKEEATSKKKEKGELELLADQIAEVGTKAAVDPETISEKTRGAWTRIVADAKAELETLKGRYRASLMRNGVAIFLDGEEALVKELGALMEAEREGVTVDASQLYERLATEIEKTFGESRTWSVPQTLKFIRELMAIGHEVGLAEMEPPEHLQESVVMPTHEDVVGYVRRSLTPLGGAHLNNLYVSNGILQEALAIRYKGSVIPIAIRNAVEDRESIARAFGKGSTTFTVEDNAKIDKEYMHAMFKTVNEQLRARK